MTIAVTGPFASGKSTFVRFLGELGAETVSSDEIVHALLRDNRRAISQIVERFGEGVKGDEGIDRGALGREVFDDPEALADLEAILHPLVRRETDRRIATSGADAFVAEIPLLFEAGRGEDFDYTVAVVVPEGRRRAWSEARGVDEAALRGIEARQFSGEEKARRANLVVQNDGDLDKLRGEAERLWRKVVRERRTGGSLR